MLSSQVGWAISSGHIIKHMKTIHQNSVYHCATAAQVNAHLQEHFRYCCSSQNKLCTLEEICFLFFEF